MWGEVDLHASSSKIACLCYWYLLHYYIGVLDGPLRRFLWQEYLA